MLQGLCMHISPIFNISLSKQISKIDPLKFDKNLI